MRWYNRRQARRDSLYHSMSVSRYSVTVQPNGDLLDDSVDYSTLQQLEYDPTADDFHERSPYNTQPSAILKVALSTSTPQLELSNFTLQPTDDSLHASFLSGIEALDDIGSSDETYE